jgi:hypothetical protein
MKRNRIEIATRLLNDVLTADYDAIRTQAIEAAEIKKAEMLASETTPEWLKQSFSNIDSTKKPASEYQAAAIKKHFENHAGHCAECHGALDDLVLPLDTKEKKDCGKWGFKYEITRLTACVLHTKELKGKTYTAKQCPACDVLFKSYGDSKFCSIACRSWFDYHQRKPHKQTAICKNCDCEFMPKRTDSLFCGTTCRVTYWRMAKRQIDLFSV